MLSFMKVPPTTYVLHFASGKLRREGAGLAFFYYTPTASIVTVPLASADVPFVFTEPTADFQTATIQGQLTYRVSDPKRLASLLDFTTNTSGKFLSDDPRKLAERLLNATQTLTHTVSQRMALRELLLSSQALGTEVLTALKHSETVAALGVEALALAILSIRPTPEMAKALEAEAREALNGRADMAIYARRKAAVEQERTIKETELNTEIAVQEKQRQIRETQMAADIAVEQQRATLLERQVENDRKNADSRAYALTQVLTPLRTMDWRTLMALGPAGGDPKAMVAMAFQEMASQAGKIGTLNISPDLLSSLLGDPKPHDGKK